MQRPLLPTPLRQWYTPRPFPTHRTPALKKIEAQTLFLIGGSKMRALHDQTVISCGGNLTFVSFAVLRCEANHRRGKERRNVDQPQGYVHELPTSAFGKNAFYLPLPHRNQPQLTYEQARHPRTRSHEGGKPAGQHQVEGASGAPETAAARSGRSPGQISCRT